MRLAFLLQTPNIRGSTVATYDYAHFSEELLNHESIVFCNEDRVSEWHPLGIERLKERFKVVTMSHISELDAALSKEKIDFMYTLRGGALEDGIPTVCRSGVHAMFQNYEPHGTVYAYISEWLSSTAKKHLDVEVPFVPHMVHGPQEPSRSLRKALNIPNDAVVFGRYGGFTQFDISMAKQAVIEATRRSKDHYFLFMNTKPFAKHPQIIHLSPETGLQEKCDFIHACDAMLHARRLGESFGMSIAEFLYQGKPVITWYTGNDLNHVHMLGDDGIYFKTNRDLMETLLTFEPKAGDKARCQHIASQFSAERTMAKFERVFLDH